MNRPAPKILFRADTRPGIGAGDLTSLVHLSAYFAARGWECYFLTRATPSAAELLRSRNIAQARFLDPACALDDDLRAIDALVAEDAIDVVFYCITERDLADYAPAAAKAYKACICCNDNLMPGIDLAVAWDPKVMADFDKSRFPRATFLFGTPYAIMPLRLYQTDRQADPLTGARGDHLLITMGGVDENDLTASVVEVLSRHGITTPLRIVLGPGYAQAESLRRTLQGRGLRYSLVQSVSDMFEEMLRCACAICTGGMTLYEMLAAGTPAAVIAAVEHQIPRCEMFRDMGAITYLGFAGFDEDALLRFVRNPSREPMEFAFKTFDIVNVIEDELRSRHAQ